MGSPVREEEEFDFGQLLAALQRRKRLAVTVLAASVVVGAAVTLVQRVRNPTFEGSVKLLVADPINTGGERGQSSTIESLALPETGATNTSTLIQVLGSPLLLEPVETRLGLPAGALERAVTVSTGSGGRSAAGGNDGVLEVRLLWPDPTQGVAILKEVTQSYLKYSLRQRQEKLNEGLAFLDQQAPELQQRVNQLQGQLANFRRANGFVAPEEQAASILEQRQGLSTQLEGLQQEQARIEGRLRAVRRGNLGTSLGSSPALQPGVGSLQPSVTSDSRPASPSSGAAVPSAPVPSGASPLQELNQVETELAEAEANFTDASPQVRELRAKRDRLRPLLQRRQEGELQADLSQNLSQQREIQRQLNRLARTFTANPNLIKQYESLQQQLEVARDNLSSYIKARENFRLQVAQRTVPWSVLVPPRFGSQPVKPSVPRNLLLSLLLGSVGGVGAALLRDRLDPVFHDPRELREVLPVPLLGTVPHLPGVQGITIKAAIEGMSGSQRFEIRESLRNLFANFRLLRADKTLRLVAVTSATQGEGKSTTTALFAETLAQLGQRVLLVDADMRRPMLHRYVGAANQEGLSSLLTDNSLELGDVVVAVQPGLDLLPAGPMPPDATRLLSSERCGALVDQIRALPGYDVVLFDTPPALLLSDPVLLASHLDGLLFVVAMERVNRELPAQALERMRDTGTDVLGVLANLASRSRPGSRGYGYGYGRYGYGGYAGYGGYEELASRYQPSGEAGGSNGAYKGVTSAPKTISRQRRPSLKRGLRSMVKWLDRRD
jgi:capsular exopolysaccharide synthesis family protein